MVGLSKTTLEPYDRVSGSDSNDHLSGNGRHGNKAHEKWDTAVAYLIADSDFAFDFGLPGRLVRCSNSHMLANFLKALDDVGHPYLRVKMLFS